MKRNPEANNNRNQSDISFQKKQQIRFFTSFKAMNEADAKVMAALSPREHLQNAVFLTQKIFAEELKKPMDKKLKFK